MKLALIALSFVGLAIAGCSLGEAASAANAAVGTFHDQYNAGEYNQIYDAADDALKENVTRAEFSAFCTSIKAQFGNVVKSKRINYRANTFKGTVSKTTVVSVYEVTFDEGVRSENFTWNIVDDEPLLESWTINLSPGG